MKPWSIRKHEGGGTSRNRAQGREPAHLRIEMGQCDENIVDEGCFWVNEKRKAKDRSAGL